MKAVVLLSGGIDSAVVLALALQQGRECHALSFDYNQNHRIELESARYLAKHYHVSHKIVTIDSTLFSGTSLVQGSSSPKVTSSIPPTYVPGRNTLFLAFAASFAESIEADEIHIGPNKDDQAGYPDCRPLFINSFQQLLNCSSKRAVEGSPATLVTRLLDRNKSGIIRLGRQLNVPLEMTHSCYSPTEEGKPCLVCGACILRENGFNSSL